MLCWTAHLRKPDANAAVAVGPELYYFGRGGYNDPDQLHVYIFNAVSLLWRKLPPVTTTRGERPPEVPCDRYGYTAVLIEHMVYIFGGSMHNRRYHNQLYMFGVRTHRWIKPVVYGTLPEGREDHSACVLGKNMYINGGLSMTRLTYDTYKLDTNDTYKLDTTTMVWSLINTGGTRSSRHSATIIGTKMFVFGGVEHQRILHNIRVFDTETNSWMNKPSAAQLPRERKCWRHSAFAHNGELYLFGDFGDFNLKSTELWKLNPETFSWKLIVPKGKGPSLSMHGTSCCMAGERVIILGGANMELFILDLNPSLKSLCKLVIIQHCLEQSGLPHNIRWELAAMTKKEH